MDNAGKLLEIVSLSENLMKSQSTSGLLRLKILYFASVYENLSVSMIIEKLGIKKSNFALMTTELSAQGLVTLKQTEIDRRCRTISLTEKGREELNAYIKQIEHCLGATSLEVERSINILLDYLNKIV